MNIHVVWAQGWDVAPPRATRNASLWESIGTVYKWSCANAIEAGLVEREVLDLAAFPAMKADVILAAAMLKFGGLAVGADMEPVQHAQLADALGEAEKNNLGLVIYQSFKDEPYSGGSYFPADHPWLRLLCERQRANLIDRGGDRRVSSVTGPFMWRQLIRRNAGLWLSSVRTVPGWVGFTHEPKTRGTYRDAWINPGLAGDWAGTKSEQWS